MSQVAAAITPDMVVDKEMMEELKANPATSDVSEEQIKAILEWNRTYMSKLAANKQVAIEKKTWGKYRSDWIVISHGEGC